VRLVGFDGGCLLAFCRVEWSGALDRLRIRVHATARAAHSVALPFLEGSGVSSEGSGRAPQIFFLFFDMSTTPLVLFLRWRFLGGGFMGDGSVFLAPEYFGIPRRMSASNGTFFFIGEELVRMPAAVDRAAVDGATVDRVAVDGADVDGADFDGAAVEEPDVEVPAVDGSAAGVRNQVFLSDNGIVGSASSRGGCRATRCCNVNGVGLRVSSALAFTHGAVPTCFIMSHI
jgi:hypothetical protein